MPSKLNRTELVRALRDSNNPDSLKRVISDLRLENGNLKRGSELLATALAADRKGADAAPQAAPETLESPHDEPSRKFAMRFCSNIC